MIDKFVDKIFVINLPHREDRLKSFDDLSKKFGFNYEVFEAFNGKKFINDDFVYDGKKVGPPYVNQNYFKGCVGCLISHLNLLKHCQKMNYKKVMIFEDDSNFHDEFNQRLLDLFSNIPDDWEMLYLSGSLPDFKENYKYYSTVNSIFTTHSYLVRSNVFQILIDNFTEKLFTSPADMCYSEIHPLIKTYVANPFLTYQSPGYSDIGDVYNDYESIRKYL